MSKAIGIDLGTANSCVAAIVDGKPVVIPDQEGNKTTPSVYAINLQQEPLVGETAINQQENNPLNTIFAVKRLIGLKYDSEEVQYAKTKLPYKIIPADNGDAWVEINETRVSPEEVSSKILVRLKQIAEEYLGEKVTRSVITVPAHFNDSQRQATKDAGRIAGMEVMRILNEPTAAALAYGMDSENQKQRDDDDERTISVFDLGGGTFDISILSMSQGIFSVKSTHGDTYLGGEDFDLEIVNFLIEHARKTQSIDLTKDKIALQRLKGAAKKAKEDLSFETEVDILLPNIAEGMANLETTLSRKDLQRICEPVLKRIEKPCLNAMLDANLIPKDITDVVLVGGMTRMPSVKKYCEKIFKKIPHEGVDPDEAVAVGAALQAALLDGLISGVEFLDVLPLSLGIETCGGKVETLVQRNTKIPTKATKIFTTSAPNQTRVSLHVVQGEEKFAVENETLGYFELSGIPKAARGYPELAVSFSIDHGGMIDVTAIDLDTKVEKKVELIAKSGLDDSAIDDLIKNARMNEDQRDRFAKRSAGDRPQEEDETPKDNLTILRDKLKQIIYTAQFRLDAEGEKYKGNKRKILIQAIKTARTSLQNITEESELESAISLLNKEVDKFNEFISDPW